MKGNCAPLTISLVLTKIKKLVGKVLLLTLGKRSQEAFQIFSFSVDQMSQHAKKEKKNACLGVIILWDPESNTIYQGMG